LGGLANGFRISSVVLLALHERFDIGRW
jgi:hypothetical protein